MPVKGTKKIWILTDDSGEGISYKNGKFEVGSDATPYLTRREAAKAADLYDKTEDGTAYAAVIEVRLPAALFGPEAETKGKKQDSGPKSIFHQEHDPIERVI